MPSLIMVNPGGAQDGTYTHHGPDDLVLYAVSADVTTGATDSSVEVRCLDQSGATIAHSRTKAKVEAGVSGQVTFAPYLPDSSLLGFSLSGQIIQTGLAATPLRDGSQVIVHPVENDAVVTEARLWVVSPELAAALEPVGPVYLLAQVS